MRANQKIILTVVLAGVVAGSYAAMTAQHVPESCRAFREQMEELVFNNNGLAGVVAAVQEATMERAIAERYASLSAEQCSARAQPAAAAIEALGHAPWGEQMNHADAEVKQAMADCHNKRVNGELKTHADSAQCSNEKIAAALERIGYPYKDLVAQFTARRLALAFALDKENASGTEDESDYARLALQIAEQEGARVAAAKK